MELVKGAGNKFYQGKGCEYCRGTGFKGREAVFELLRISGDKMRDIIASGLGVPLLKKIAVEKEGFRSLKENGLRKVLRGVTTLEEVLQATELV
jgi:type II secretory ATPase GspE/PulE/Tfp pilus assembly ATPase PilB-like protein